MAERAAGSGQEGRPCCVYVVSRYPAVTHTFILREVRALRALGVDVQTVSIRRATDRDVLSPVDEQERRTTHALLPPRPVALAMGHLRALTRAPGAYARTLGWALRIGRGGPRRRLWQLFYFAEAIMLWAWLEPRRERHLHAHFSNVGSDVSMLVARFGNAAHRGGQAGGWSWSFTVHGPTEFGEVSAHRLTVKLVEADAVLCGSDFARSQLMALMDPSIWAKLHTFPFAADLETFQPAERAPAGPEGRPLEILNVAALEPRKGQSLLVAAVAQLRERGVPVHLTLVGDGPARGAVQQEVARRGLGSEVTLAGAVGQHQILDYYRAADVFCLPSFAEGLPAVLLEAMATGLPVVASHIMGIPELVEHHRSGLLVTPGRVDELVNALERLAGDPELRAGLGRAGRERVARDYALPLSAARVHGVLAPLLGRP